MKKISAESYRILRQAYAVLYCKNFKRFTMYVKVKTVNRKKFEIANKFENN